MTTNHIRVCAVTGKRIEAGDRFITTPAGTYAVKSNIRLTDEQRTEIETKLFGTSFRKIVTPDVYAADDSQQDDAGAWTPDTPDVDAALPSLNTDTSADTSAGSDSDGVRTGRSRSTK